MNIIRNIFLGFFVFIIAVFIAAFSFNYFIEDRGNLLKDQEIFNQKANSLALKFISDFDSKKLDSIIYNIQTYRFWAGHGKWYYGYTLFNGKSFGSYVDNSQSILVKQQYYSSRNQNNGIDQFKTECSTEEMKTFEIMKGIRSTYALNEIGHKGRVFNFDNGIAYFNGSEIDMLKVYLPVNIRQTAKRINNNWYKIIKQQY
jgi:glycosidase